MYKTCTQNKFVVNNCTLIQKRDMHDYITRSATVTLRHIKCVTIQCYNKVYFYTVRKQIIPGPELQRAVLQICFVLPQAIQQCP